MRYKIFKIILFIYESWNSKKSKNSVGCRVEG